MMTWIKNHPAQTAVIALSLSLTASSVELYRQSSSLPLRHTGSMSEAPSRPTPENERADVGSASATAGGPSLWQATAPGTGRLFAAKQYVLIDGKLQRPEGKMFRPPVPNDDLMKHGLDPLASDVLASDPDQDGFTTLQEWEGADGKSHLDPTGKPVVGTDGGLLANDSTSPVDASSHPPYHTRLFLDRVEQIPFQLRFLSDDIDARNPGKITVQINAVPGRSEFVEVGQSLKHAPFDVVKFTPKDAPARDGTTKNVSEVVVVDRRTAQEVTLPKGEVVSSPESYAILRYDWTGGTPPAAKKDPAHFRLRKNETFRLPPQGDVYRVAEIRLDGVDLVTPSGRIYTVRAPQPAKQ